MAEPVLIAPDLQEEQSEDEGTDLALQATKTFDAAAINQATGGLA